MREAKGPKGEGVQRLVLLQDLIDAGGNNAQAKRTSTRSPSDPLSPETSKHYIHQAPHQSGNGDIFGSPAVASSHRDVSKRFPDPKDWLTGDDDGTLSLTARPTCTSTDGPVLREFTNKRGASYSNLPLPKSLHRPRFRSAEQLPSLPSPSPTKFRSIVGHDNYHRRQNTSPRTIPSGPNRTARSLHRGRGTRDAQRGFMLLRRDPKRSPLKRGRETEFSE